MVVFGLVAQLVRSGAEEATGRLISVGSEVQILPGPPFPPRCASLGSGGVAQLGEHLLCKQGVVGSNPSVSRVGGVCRVSAAMGGRGLERWTGVAGGCLAAGWLAAPPPLYAASEPSGCPTHTLAWQIAGERRCARGEENSWKHDRRGSR